MPYLFSILAGEIFMTYRYDGRWQWAKTGPPSGRVAAELPIGVVVGQPLNGQAERPYVFVRGTDGHLWVCSLVGVDWVWTDLGTPPGGDIVAAVGAVASTTVRASPAGRTSSSPVRTGNCGSPGGPAATGTGTTGARRPVRWSTRTTHASV